MKVLHTVVVLSLLKWASCTECKDIPYNCASYKHLCEEKPQMMESLCPKTCGFCTEVQTPTGHWRNCEEIRKAFLKDFVGDPPSMLREIYPYEDEQDKSVRVYCEETLRRGGWTVIQYRGNYSEDFNTHRKWQDYKNGFGDPGQNHWIGLDTISALTNQGPTELLIVLNDFEGSSRFAHYDQFVVYNEATGYKMEVSGYSGDAGDSFSYHSGQKFSTVDRDNDSHGGQNCAEKYSGAWWYKTCHYSNLNGQYLNGVHKSFADGINWRTWHGYHYSLKATKMMIRPRRLVKK